MRRASYLSLSALTAACLCTQSVCADFVAFQDGFEGNSVGTTLGPPTIGQSWTDASTFTPPTAANADPAVQVTDSPVLGGSRALALRRQDGYNSVLRGLSLPGVLVPGNTVELKWSHNLEAANRANGPMQISIGHAGSTFSSGQLMYMLIDTVNATPLTSGFGAYGYSEGPATTTANRKYSTATGDRIRASLNTPGANEGRWDNIRMVLSLNAVGSNQLGGTMDLFIDSADDLLGEVQIADDALLQTTTPSGLDPTSLQIGFFKGASSGISFYDNISVTVVPEPTLGFVAAGLGTMLLRRNKR